MDQPFSQRHEQRLLAFPIDGDYSFASLTASPSNEGIIATIRGLEAGAALVLVGAAGTGKSHLLRATVLEVRDQQGAQSAVYLEVAELARQLTNLTQTGAAIETILVDFLEHYTPCHWVAVDGLEQLSTSPLAQEALLYLFNRMRALGGRLLCASRLPPGEIANLRDDLRTRLLWGAALRLPAPDDDQLAAMLHKMATDRGVRLATEVIRFLVSRLPRQAALCATALERLDQEALRQKRPITVPLAKEVLGL